MATMSMNQIIHAAVRRDVARTERALRALPEGDRARARQLQGAWRNLVRELTHHHESEDELVWPFLLSRGLDAELMGTMEGEHAAMRDALADASRAIDEVVGEPTAVRAHAAADVVSRSSLVINSHLEHEEQDVEPLVAQFEDDPEWKAVAKRLRPAALADAGSALAWMQDGASERELASLRATIPGPVVAVMSRVFGRRYAREVAPTWR
ncbi:hemerythrin domain-containing protein [Nocardioides sp. LHG3406-4]|uniref:hemerythrin domain-containing protein n=1 Tax=Nocardioides sp. LHG3406-4 TaxID=2804575 RepID=UPI003CF781E6